MSTACDPPDPAVDGGPDDAAPIGAAEAAALFADLAPLPALILAVSGGPDSTALLWLAARWRAALSDGPRLVAVTVDHGLRAEAAAEAEAVGVLAETLGVAHRVLRWTGDKPTAGLQEAARAARYRLLAEAAGEAGAGHILTAHTRDDQAETVLFRLARGSGLSGLAGMARAAAVPCGLIAKEEPPTPDPSPPFADANGGRGVDAPPPVSIDRAEAPPLPSPRERSSWRGGVGGGGQAPGSAPSEAAILLLRPFLDIPKARLVATLRAAGVAFADDPSNRDPRFTRSRLRRLAPALAVEGLSPARLTRLAERMRRADVALEIATDRLAGDLGLAPGDAPPPAGAAVRVDALAWVKAPEELRIRLLGRLVATAATEGPVELGKLEAVAAALHAAVLDPARPPSARFRRTVAGAMVTLSTCRFTVEPAPARRVRRNAAGQTRVTKA